MSANTSKGPHVDDARPILRLPKRTDVDRVKSAQSMGLSVQASANWGQATAVQAALPAVTKSGSDIAANAKVIADLQTQLRNAVAQQRILRRGFGVSVRALLNAVEVFAQGSVDTVKSFGLEVLSRTAHGPLPAPASLFVQTGKLVGQVTAKWVKGLAGNGFVVQHATDITNPATYSALQPSTKTSCTLTGLTSGTSVHVRVAAVDPAAPQDLGPWSDWASGTVR
jgi:hypothetical protein